MTLEELQKIIGQQNSGLQLKMPVRETNPNYNYDDMGQPIIPEIREHIPNRALKIGADALSKTRDFYNTGNGFIGELLVGSGGDALESMAYGYKPKTQNLVDLGLLGVSPFIGGVKGFASTANKIDEIKEFIPKSKFYDTSTAFTEKTKNNFYSMLDRYKNSPETFYGRKIDTDIARELFPEYNKSNFLNRILGISGNRNRASEIHPGANKFSNMLFNELLTTKIPKGVNDKVTFLSGGAGAGKTSALKRLPKNEKPDFLSKIFYDSNFSNPNKAIKKINKAIKSHSGKTPVDIFYVNRNPLDSYRGTIARSLKEKKLYGSGRTVPIDKFKETHEGSLKTIKKLKKHYKNNPLVNIKIIDNNSKIPKISTLNKLPKITFKELSNFFGPNLTY